MKSVASFIIHQEVIGSSEAVGHSLVKGELLTDKVNYCLALLLITIYVDNSWCSWRSWRFVTQGQPALPRPAPAVLGSGNSHSLGTWEGRNICLSHDAEAALQRHQWLFTFFSCFFLLCSLHIDQGSEHESEAGLIPPLVFLGAQANRDVKDFLRVTLKNNSNGKEICLYFTLCRVGCATEAQSHPWGLCLHFWGWFYGCRKGTALVVLRASLPASI